ncbi:MAG: hypothetical protein K8S27_15395 [Candidatus Omnitrophica bacterium]|nr:hypothetical protein [Candidatus Omnitrophota bacterium]
MIFYTVMSIGVVFLMSGIILLIKGFNVPSEDEYAVPISDLTEINEIKRIYQKKKLEQQEARHASKSSFKKKTETPFAKTDAVARNDQIIRREEELVCLKQFKSDAEQEIRKLRQENFKLKSNVQKMDQTERDETLSRENATYRQELASKENVIHELKDKMVLIEKHLSMAVLERDHLEKDSLRLKAEIQNYSDTSSRMEDQIQSKDKEISLNRANVIELEQKVKGLEVYRDSLSSEYASRQDMLSSLEKDQEDLSGTIKELNQKVYQHEQTLSAKSCEVERLTQELRKLDDESLNKDKDFYKELQLLRQENQELLMKYRGSQKQVQEFQQEIGRVDLSEVHAQLKDNHSQLGLLKEENDTLTEYIDRLNGKIEGMKDGQSRMLKKEHLLQYELTKNRAKVIGLERICEAFKEKIEALPQERSKKVSF